MIRRPREDELEIVATLVASLQSHPETRNAFFGATPGEVAALLASWEKPWFQTSLVAERGGRLAAFLGAELADSANRVWLHGPIVRDPAWDEIADDLLASLGRAIPEVSEKEQELAADAANARVAAFAARHDFVAGKVHDVLELPAQSFAALPVAGALALEPADHEAFAHLHDELFPGTYYSADELLDQAARGDALIVGVVHARELVGYAAGRIDEAGDGYIDFVGVSPTHRGHGHGGTLVASVTRALATRAPIAKVSLTVSTENAAALALYRRLAFTKASSAVGYRRPPHTALPQAR